MRRRTGLVVPGHPAGTLESALEIIRPRADDGPGRAYGRQLRTPPDISPVPPAPGERATGWPHFGGGLQKFTDDEEYVELPGNVEDYATDPRLSGQQRACLVVAVARSFEPEPPDPEPEPDEQVGEKEG